MKKLSDIKVGFAKRLAAVLCAACVGFGASFSVSAVTEAEVHEANDRANDLFTTMMLLLEYYVGDEDVSVQSLFDDAMLGMTSGLDDYTTYFDAAEYSNFAGLLSDSFVGLGIYYSADESSGYIVISSVMSGSPAEAAGLAANDLITAIGGTSTKGLTTDKAAALISAAGDTVSLTVSRGTQSLTFSVTKGEISTSSVLYTSDISKLGIENADKSVGYIAIKSISESTDEHFRQVVAELKSAGVTKLILDLRDNGGGYLEQAVEICRLIVPAGAIINTYNKEDNMTAFYSDLVEKPFSNIAVLVDGNTASAAEVIASAIQDSGAGFVVGSQTYGKGVIQSLYTYETGGAIKFTTEEYYTRNGNKLNGIGVTPDVLYEYLYWITEFELDASNNAEEVVNLKKAMALLGYSISEYGKNYTAELTTAVKKFQEGKNLETTGSLDKDTIDALNLALDDYYKEEDYAFIKAYEAIISR